MNWQNIINAIALPNSSRTLASEKAIKDYRESADPATGSGQCDIQLTLEFGFPIAHLQSELEHAIRTQLAQAGFAGKLDVRMSSKIVAHKVQQGVNTMTGVKNIIAIASGKGGVGKSTTTANLAMAMAKMGARVGVLDADLYGPSQPTMLGVANAQPEQRNGKFIPVTADGNIQVMSIGFLVDTDQAVVWRGPMLSQALQQLLFQSEWDDVDYLFIDLPPGTGDIQLTLSQKIPVTGAVVVTTPQDIALIDARKAIDMFSKVNIPIVGVLENMSVHICSNCQHSEAIFGSDGGKHLAEKLNVPLLGQLPLTLAIREAMDAGATQQLQNTQTAVAQIYQNAAQAIAFSIADKGRDYSHSFPKIVVQ